jgi:retron-type reverse transcriptase
MKSYLTEINGNINMRLSAVNQLQDRRSESTVVDNGGLGATHIKSSQSCEVTSLRRIHEEAKALLNPFENRLKKGSRTVQKTFSIRNLTKVMHEYYSAINLSEHPKNPDEKLFNILSDPCFLFLAYSSLKKDAAAGLDSIDNGNFTLSGIRSLSRDLQFEKYTCVSSRRIYINKPQGGKRPLGIPGMRDKTVQKGLLMLLQPTLERSFSDLSHGFRPERSCHTALKSIRQQGNRTTWFIELILVNAFEKVHHELLLQEIKTFVSEQRIFDLIYQMLKVGYINPFDLSDSNLDKEEVAAQGSILSPFFANILFSRLDRWVENVLLPRYNRKRIGLINLKYLRIYDKHSGTPRNKVLEVIKESAPPAASKKVRKTLCEVRKYQVAKDKIKYYATDPIHRRL